MTDQQRRNILRNETRRALANLKPQQVGFDGNTRLGYTPPQINAARGIARRRALAIIDAGETR